MCLIKIMFGSRGEVTSWPLAIGYWLLPVFVLLRRVKAVGCLRSPSACTIAGYDAGASFNEGEWLLALWCKQKTGVSRLR